MTATTVPTTAPMIAVWKSFPGPVQDMFPLLSRVGLYPTGQTAKRPNQVSEHRVRSASQMPNISLLTCVHVAHPRTLEDLISFVEDMDLIISLVFERPVDT